MKTAVNIIKSWVFCNNSECVRDGPHYLQKRSRRTAGFTKKRWTSYFSSGCSNL